MCPFETKQHSSDKALLLQTNPRNISSLDNLDTPPPGTILPTHYGNLLFFVYNCKWLLCMLIDALRKYIYFSCTTFIINIVII